MAAWRSGQGATEYLVLLAVVLIIALVSIALLGFFPGIAGDARIAQSQTYWRGQARPFAILEHSVTAAGIGTFVVQSTEATGILRITSFGIANATNATAVSFAPGEVKSVSVNGLQRGTAGATYDFNATITYATPTGLTNKQYGSKSIVGKYG